MPALRRWDKRPVHLGAPVRFGRAVVPVCARRMIAFDYHRATWSMLLELVTCQRCLDLVAEEMARAILRDPGLLIIDDGVDDALPYP